MRSVKEIMRTYVAVNKDGGPKSPIRFGSIVALAGILILGLVLLSGGGPARYDDGGSLSTGSSSDGAATGPLEYKVMALPGGGAYFGYDRGPIDAAEEATMELDRAAQEAMAHSLNDARLGLPTAVHKDGHLIGYEVRPATATT